MGTPRRHRRAGWWLLGGGLVVLVGLWAAFVAVRLLAADRALRAGIAAASEARGKLTLSSLTGDPAAASLARAEADFRRAHADVAGFPVAPLGIVPIVGTQIHSVTDLSGAAATVSAAGSKALAQASGLLRRPRATPAQRAAVLVGLAATLDPLARTIDAVDLGLSHGLLAPLADKRNTFATDLLALRHDLGKAAGAVSALASLFQGPSTYLVIGANNAEMRAGAGMALEAGTLRAADGMVHLTSLEPTGLLIDQGTAVRPTGDLAARWGFEHPAVDFRDLLLSPQFPPNAALAAQMWQARTGIRVQGVILIDVPAIADLLGVTGPVQADGTTIDAGDAEQYLLEQEYAGLPTDGTALEVARHTRLGALAAATVSRVEAPGVSVTALVGALDRAADGRDVMAWSSDPAVERNWVAAGVGGQVDGDDLLLALLNQGGNKLDPYQQVTARGTVTVAGGRSTVQVTVAVRNATPPSVTGYAAGGGPGGPPPRVYRGALALDFPRYAGYAEVPGQAVLEVSGADYGADVLAAPVTVRPDHTVTVRFRFVLLGEHGSLDIQPSARVPSTTWSWQLPGGRHPVSFTDGTATAVSW